MAMLGVEDTFTWHQKLRSLYCFSFCFSWVQYTDILNNVVICYLKFNAGLIGLDHQHVAVQEVQGWFHVKWKRFKPNTTGYGAYLVIYVKMLLGEALVSGISVFFVYMSQYMERYIPELCITKHVDWFIAET